MSGTNGGYGNGRPRFTTDDLHSICAAWDAGESAASIARRYRCHPSAIQYHLRRTLRVVPLRDRDVVRAARCVRCGIDTDHVGLCRDCCDVEKAIA